ncbi:MAG: hypothetical protein Q8939_05425, partial [Bacteroidota bacterium]|nr:hypothetical protein [Bacteroidota bacterium]
MKALIIETPKKQAETLQEVIRSIDNKTEIISSLSTAEEAILYFRTQPQPDLLFFEIDPIHQLSFQLFDHVEIACPVVFIIRPGQSLPDDQLPNCIDVLIKPLDPFHLRKCFQHYRELQEFFIKNHSSLFEYFNGKERIKSRILIRKGTEYQT